MKIAKERNNRTIQAVEDAQSNIREVIQNAYIFGEPFYTTERKIKNIINSAIVGIDIDRLKHDIIISLTNFANNQRQMWIKSGIPAALLLLLNKTAKNIPQELVSVVDSSVKPDLTITPQALTKGVPLQQFYKTVWVDKVLPKIEMIAAQNALDPNDFSGRNSLRNLAEMEVRYKNNQESVQELINNGVKIVACSSHADCSNRCAPYQGKLYSLDGSDGLINGIKYRPLEYATQNPRDRYVTKAGRVYQNGLMGFNCRHYLIEYTGQLLPTISKEERKREYGITETQRFLEREVRKIKIKALMLKPIDKAGYLQEQKRAAAAYKKYVEFSKTNNRPFYKIRTQI